MSATTSRVYPKDDAKKRTRYCFTIRFANLGSNTYKYREQEVAEQVRADWIERGKMPTSEL